ncbi:MAG TPA: response regulator, partial [Polyangiales bacterium]
PSHADNRARRGPCATGGATSMKILIVDDEPVQSRGLSRAILHRRPDFAVLTALNGREAIMLLEEQHVDLVLTDLRMDEMDGFELLAWVLTERPGMLTFAMTGYASDESQNRLRGLGAIECFSKPLDIDALLMRLADAIAQNLRGHLQNVGLASFLQLIELEQKTCTLEVRRGPLLGMLYLRRGELLDASAGELSGEEAALSIVGWLNATVTVHGGCELSERRIQKSLSHLVIDAMRLRDENSHRRDSERSEALARGGKDSFLPLVADALAPVNNTPRSLDGRHLPVGALAMAVVELATGAVLASDDRAGLNVAAFAEAAAVMLRRQHSDMTRAEPADTAEDVEELVFTTSTRCELIRLMPKHDVFVLLVFDMTQTNLVMARLELERFMSDFQAP